MRKIWILFLFFFVGTAHAAQFLKVTKSNSVIGYKEPTAQSKMLKVFAQGDEIEIILNRDGWYRVKIPFTQGYFLLGWVPSNAPNITIFKRESASIAEVSTAPMMMDQKIQPANTKKATKNSIDPDRSESSEMDRWTSDSQQYVKAFFGPVYDLHNYSAFQYKFGAAYEMPITQRYKLGIPLSYLTGDGFNAIMFGMENTYSFYFDWFAIQPRLGLGYEYFYGNSKSFHAFSAEIGFSFDVSVSKHFTLGVEPFTVQPMFWNSTDSLNKIPFNVRGQSLFVIRGRW
jgi:hypothetical protein